MHDALVTRPLLFLPDVEGSGIDRRQPIASRSTRNRMRSAGTISLQVACFCPRITSSSNRSPSNFDRMKSRNAMNQAVRVLMVEDSESKADILQTFCGEAEIYVWRSRGTEAET